MEPHLSHSDRSALPTRQRNRSGAVVDFNAKQLSRALDAEAKALRSIHTFLSKTLKNLEVERTCLEVMARTVSNDTSEPILAQAVLQDGAACLSHALIDTGNMACSRFCENLLPAMTSEDVGGSQDVWDVISPVRSAPAEQVDGLGMETVKRIRRQRRGKQKKARAGIQDVSPGEECGGKSATTCVGTDSALASLAPIYLEDTQALDLALSSALRDANELLADLPGDENRDCDAWQHCVGAGGDDGAVGADEFIHDDALTAIDDMNAILDSDDL